MINDARLASFDPYAPIGSGDYLHLVVYGPAQVKTNRTTAVIHPEDLLTVGGSEGTSLFPFSDLVAAGSEQARP